jgi:hypothetical protein
MASSHRKITEENRPSNKSSLNVIASEGVAPTPLRQRSPNRAMMLRRQAEFVPLHQRRLLPKSRNLEIRPPPANGVSLKELICCVIL